MNVPTDILDKLKCSNCEDLLSCGPVKQKHDGSNICGRCSNLQLEEPVVSNQTYNALAELCAFPCKYEAAGCTERVLFNHMMLHEADCEFRTYVCPVLESGRCEWVGPRNRLLEHVQEAHPGRVLTQPAVMQHDVRTSSLKTFLMAAYNVLFLVQVKVCLATHTIYHSVRKLGGTYEYQGRTFKFFVDIKNNNGSLKRKRDVAPQGFMVLQEDSAIGIEINTIMKALSGYNNTKFIITIQEYMECLNCRKIINCNLSHFVTNIFIKTFCCQDCSQILNLCANASEGCSWKGLHKTHQTFVCLHTKWCTLCSENINESNTVLGHMEQNHNIDYLYGKFCTMLKNKNKTITFSFKNLPYVLIYKRSFRNTFIVQGSPDETNIQCIFNIRNAKTKYTSHYLMPLQYCIFVGQVYFYLVLYDNQLEPFVNDNEFEIGVDIHCYK